MPGEPGLHPLSSCESLEGIAQDRGREEGVRTGRYLLCVLMLLCVRLYLFKFSCVLSSLWAPPCFYLVELLLCVGGCFSVGAVLGRCNKSCWVPYGFMQTDGDFETDGNGRGIRHY